MQIPSSTLTLREYVLGSLVGLLALGGSSVAYLLGRRQRTANTANTEAETANTEAETAKTVAETRQVEVETAKNAGDIVLGLIREVAAATVRAERIQDERDHWERKAKDLEAELRLVYHQLNQKTSLNQLPPFKEPIE